jgi:L-lactate dehydrogenase
MAQGEALDLLHGSAIAGQQKIYAGGYERCRDSDIVVITAGLRRKPDESRLDLINRNVALFRQILDSLKTASLNSGAIILVVSNPVDILTRLVLDQLKWDPARTLGLGTQLDTARFRSLIAQETGMPAGQITALILGEHGDSMVPIWSGATAAGIPLVKLPNFSTVQQARIFERTKASGAEAIKLKGGAGWAVALSIAQIVRAIALNQPAILPVSTQLAGEYGIRGTCMSVPTLIDARGVARRYAIEVWPREEAGLVASAKALDNTYRQIK